MFIDAWHMQAQHASFSQAMALVVGGYATDCRAASLVAVLNGTSAVYRCTG